MLVIKKLEVRIRQLWGCKKLSVFGGLVMLMARHTRRRGCWFVCWNPELESVAFPFDSSQLAMLESLKAYRFGLIKIIGLAIRHQAPSKQPGFSSCASYQIGDGNGACGCEDVVNGIDHKPPGCVMQAKR